MDSGETRIRGICIWTFPLIMEQLEGLGLGKDLTGILQFWGLWGGFGGLEV